MARKRANKEGTVYKLPSGRWCAQLSLEGQRLSKSFDTQKEGLNWIRKTRGHVDDGMNYASTKITLGDFLKEWLQNTKAARQHSTWIKSEQICKSYIIPNLGQLKIKDLRPEHIQKLYGTLLDQEVGDWTVIKVHTAQRPGTGNPNRDDQSQSIHLYAATKDTHNGDGNS